jgi:hypothetical protein
LAKLEASGNRAGWDARTSVESNQSIVNFPAVAEIRHAAPHGVIGFEARLGTQARVVLAQCPSTREPVMDVSSIVLLVVVGVAVLTVALFVGKAWGKQAPSPNSPVSDGTTRQFLTLSIFLVSALGILALAVTTISLTGDAAERKENVRLVFAAVIPLLASWVGTVIAYYYSRENLAAATNSVTLLAKVGAQKLDGIPVTQKMITKDKIDTKPLSELEKLALKDVLAFLHAKSRQRLPVFDAKDSIKYIMHESMINRFITEQVMAGKAAGVITFNDLVADPVSSKTFVNSFALVPKSATLADAKQRLESMNGAEDVFVTENGKPDEAVIGWLTDNMLSDEAKL